MMIHEFDAELLNEKVQLFPDEIENNPWIVYHGTSSVYENEIDSIGFMWEPSLFTKDEISNVVDIYTIMDWAGNDQGGFVVLKGYSIDHDFSTGNTKPIYFGETSYRSLLYATKSFAGGETARALRKSIQDLENYLEDKNIRDADTNYRMLDYNKLVSLNAQVGEPPKEVDLLWLKNEVEKLQSLKEKCLEVYSAHEYGVIYAVKFDQEDIKNSDDFEFNSCMGLKVFSKISPEKIVGKVHIPIDLIDLGLSDIKQIDVLLADGIIGKLNRR